MVVKVSVCDGVLMDTRLQVLDVFRLRLIFCVFLDTYLILAVVLQLIQVVCGGSNTCGNTFGSGLEPHVTGMRMYALMQLIVVI